MITWTRLLAGRLRDPLVGRDILFGVLCGVLYALLLLFSTGVSARFNIPVFSLFNVGNLNGVRAATTNLTRILTSALTGGLSLFLVLFLFRILLRKQWIAATAFVALFTFNQAAQNQYSATEALISGTVTFTVIYGLLVLIMMRLGFFAFMVTLFTLNAVLGLFLTLDFGAWYGQSSALIVVFIAALAVWGFHLSLAGRPVFGSPPDTA
jgi:hypothetical protein